MVLVLIALTGVDYWTFADGTKHACGYWPEELATPHQVFMEAGFDIAIATPRGVTPTDDKAGYTPEMNGGSAEAGQQIADYIDSIADELGSARVLEDVDSADFDLLFVPGGHGPMEDLAVSVRFGELVREFADAGKRVAAVCHGPAGLLPAVSEDGSWLFAGYKLTGFSNTEEEQVGYADKADWLLEDRLIARGGRYLKSANPWEELVVVDRNLYTGQNPASSGPLARRLVADVTNA
jgi:putative intracellular protease/amidase